MKNNFGDRLKAYAKENNYTQETLGKLLNVTKGYISSIMNNKKQPSKGILNQLSIISGKSESWWINGKDETENLDALNNLLDCLITSGEIKKMVVWMKR